MSYIPPHRRTEKIMAKRTGESSGKRLAVGDMVQIVDGRKAMLWNDNGDGTWDVTFEGNNEELGGISQKEMKRLPEEDPLLRHHSFNEGLTPTVYTGAKILCYGDSLTAGLHYSNGNEAFGSFAPYAESLAGALDQSCDHAGMCGWTSEQMLIKVNSVFHEAFGLTYPGLRQLLKTGNYSVVLLMVGTNDIGHCIPEMILRNLASLHNMCHEAGARTVAISVPQSQFTSDHTTTSTPASRKFSLRAKQQKLNSLLESYAEANNEKCKFVDMESTLPWRKESPNWEPDGLHMSKLGYTEFGKLLGPKIIDFIRAGAATSE